jgi:hypothetical protein
MYHSRVSVLPETIQHTHPRPPVVERIAGWSSRRRKTAVFGWLLLIAALFLVSQALGPKNVPDYDPGQAGQAEQALRHAAPGYYGSSAEAVLIQPRAAGGSFADDAGMRQAARSWSPPWPRGRKRRRASGRRWPATAGHWCRRTGRLMLNIRLTRARGPLARLALEALGGAAAFAALLTARG